MIDYLLYIIVKLISEFLMILPASLIVWLGRIIGNLGFYFDRKHRAVAYTNIKIAFGNKKNIKELNRITKETFVNFIQNILELLRFPLFSSKYFERFIEIQDKELIDEAMRKNKGLIILAVHFGNWEIANAACATLKYPYKIVARMQQKNTKLDNLLNSYRQLKEDTIISRGSQTRDILRSLKNNEIVGMVIDQGGKEGVSVKFFNKTTSMHTGALRLALKFEVPVIMSFIIRRKGSRHRIMLFPLNLQKTDNLETDVKINLEKINRLAEQIISKYPQQYHWFYKVWKYSDERSIVILSDGKAGHLRQSQAVSKIMAQELSGRGLITHTSLVGIKFKNNLSKLITILLSLRYTQGHIGCLKNFFKEDSFDNFTKISADFVISCGSSIASVNLILSKETKAKSIAIMRAGILGLKRFDLAIIPRHDMPPKRKNIVATDGALNLIDKEYLEAHSDELINQIPSLKNNEKKRIGVLIGGETKNYTLSWELMNRVIKQIKDVSEKVDLEILLTSSRRTPQEVDNLLKANLSNFSRCKLLVIANENNLPEAVGGILGLSQIILTSSDSISMISEAASSGKTVVVFKINLRKNRKPNLRHQKFLDNLSTKGYIILVESNDIRETIEDIIKNNKTTRTLQDNRILTEPIRQIL